jgi:hypothetical protein
MVTGLTGDPIHIGAWGTPDIGLTEYLSNAFGQGRTAQGGSNLTGNINDTTLVPSQAGNPSSGFVQATTPINKPATLGVGTTNTNINTNKPSSPADSELQALAKTNRNPVQESRYQELLAQQGASQPDIQSQIDAIYNPSFDYLNQAQSNLEKDYPNVIGNIQNQYDVNNQMLSDQNTSGLSQLDRNAVSASNRKEDALSSARRLYDELRRGYQQRFGGSTSAGQASTELASVEQQRQMGQTTRSYADTVAQIEYQKSDLNRGYSTAVMKLKYDTDAAKNQAQSDFQSKLLSIQQNRSQIESAKAQASLTALQEYRNQLFQISQQNMQFQQTLELQKSQATTALDSYAKQLALSGQGSQSALTNYFNSTSMNPSSALTVGASNGANTTANYTGQIGKTIKGYDQYGQPIYG